MKKILLTLGLGFLLVSFAPLDNYTAIINALKAADAENLSKYFDNYIDYKLPEKDEIKNIGRNQAGIALGNFFKENKINGFDLTSQRDMNGSMYLAGKLQSASKGYNITILLKTKDGNLQIISIRIS